MGEPAIKEKSLTGRTVNDAQSKYWSLHYRKTGTLIDALTWPQLRSILKTIEPGAVDKWLIWCEGEPDWCELKDCKDTILAAPEKIAGVPAMTPKLSVEGAEGPSKKLDLRMAKRFRRNIDLIIDFKGRLLKARTTDVSILGMKLENDLPFKEGEAIPVLLQIKPKAVDLICEVICDTYGNTSMTRRLRILPSRNVQKLATFLSEGSNEK